MDRRAARHLFVMEMDPAQHEWIKSRAVTKGLSQRVVVANILKWAMDKVAREEQK